MLFTQNRSSFFSSPSFLPHNFIYAFVFYTTTRCTMLECVIDVLDLELLKKLYLLRLLLRLLLGLVYNLYSFGVNHALSPGLPKSLTTNLSSLITLFKLFENTNKFRNIFNVTKFQRTYIENIIFT